VGALVAVAALATLAFAPALPAAVDAAAPTTTPLASTIDDAVAPTTDRNAPRRRVARLAPRRPRPRPPTAATAAWRRWDRRWTPPPAARGRRPTWRGPPAPVAA
jgi:hypothetical protein